MRMIDYCLIIVTSVLTFLITCLICCVFFNNDEFKIDEKVCQNENIRLKHQIERLENKLEYTQKELNKRDFSEIIQKSKEQTLTDLYKLGLLDNNEVVIGFDGTVKGIKEPCKKE